jgi:anthranilate synthase/aminodeoxychorismate synthase-like glutamine amidotransferase
MILLIDNYDSFTYNLVQRLGEIDPGVDLKVVRNDQVTLDEIEASAPSHLIISPGPCTPVEAGISNRVVARFGPEIPLLGVCLGHQCIGYALGGKIVRADRIMHGKTSWIHHDGRGIYSGIPNPFEATRYHSLVIERSSLPEELDIVAWTDQDEIMGVRHRRYPIEGVQYHPESFLTSEGINLLRNFLDQGIAYQSRVESTHADRRPSA